MLFSLKSLSDYSIQATDGEIGKIDQVFFDDEGWPIRYLIVEPGKWFDRTKVLLSPFSVKAMNHATHRIEVNLSRDQVTNSPEIDAQSPLSRQMEEQYFDHYRWPYYWTGAGVFGTAATLGSDFYLPPADPIQLEALNADNKAITKYDVHLHSTKIISGFHVDANDGEFGHVDDFIVDDQGWFIRYLVVKFRILLTSRSVLIAKSWVTSLNEARRIQVLFPREEIKNSPSFDTHIPLDRDYEILLHRYYGQQGYWESEKPSRSKPAA